MWLTFALALSVICLELIPGVCSKSTVSETAYLHADHNDTNPDVLNRTEEDNQWIHIHRSPISDGAADNDLQLESLYEILEKGNVALKNLLADLGKEQKEIRIEIKSTRQDVQCQIQSGNNMTTRIVELENKHEVWEKRTEDELGNLVDRLEVEMNSTREGFQLQLQESAHNLTIMLSDLKKEHNARMERERTVLKNLMDHVENETNSVRQNFQKFDNLMEIYEKEINSSKLDFHFQMKTNRNNLTAALSEVNREQDERNQITNLELINIVRRLQKEMNSIKHDFQHQLQESGQNVTIMLAETVDEHEAHEKVEHTKLKNMMHSLVNEIDSTRQVFQEQLQESRNNLTTLANLTIEQNSREKGKQTELRKLLHSLENEINSTREDMQAQIEASGNNLSTTLANLVNKQKANNERKYAKLINMTHGLEARVKKLEPDCQSGIFGDAGQGMSCYGLYPIMKTWHQAELFCVENDGHLAGVETEAEMRFIGKFLRNASSIANMWWIGGHDTVTENEWVWVGTGTPVTYTNWHESQPNNFGGIEDCMATWHPSWMWYDRNCSLERENSILCEYKLK